MKYGRIISVTLFLTILAVVGFVIAQDSSAAVIVLPGSGSVGTGYTITLMGFQAEEDVSLVITHVTNDEVYFQTTLTTDDEGSASTVIHSQRDDAPGEYRVQASVAEGASASASFQILSSEEAEERSAPGPRYSDATAIQNGEWVGETTTESGVIAYSFSANSGDILDAQLSSEVFDAYLVLLNSAGAELTMDDDSGPDLNAHISEYTLPETGDYTLLATSWRFYNLGESDSTGEFRLDFQLTSDAVSTPSSEVSPSTSTTTETDSEGEFETEISASLSESEPVMRYTFRAVAGQSISARLRSDEFDPYLMIENTAGETLVSDDDGDGGLNSRIEDFTFSEAGEYSIVVSSWEYIHVDDAAVSGAFNLLVWGDEIDWLSDDDTTAEQAAPAPPPEQQDEEEEEETESDADSSTDESDATPETETSVSDEPASETDEVVDTPTEIIEIPISYGDRLATPIGESETGLRYALIGVAGDRIDIAVSSYSKLDTHIAIHAPDGTLLAADDDSGRGYNPELLGLYLPQDGTYIITLDPVWQGDGQPVSIAIDLREPLVLSDGVLSIKLNNKQSMEVVSLTIEAAGDIRLRAYATGSASDVITFDALQSGNTLATLQHSGLSEIEWLFTAPEAGEIRMLFGYEGENWVSFTLEQVVDQTESDSSEE